MALKLAFQGAVDIRVELRASPQGEAVALVLSDQQTQALFEVEMDRLGWAAFVRQLAAAVPGPDPAEAVDADGNEQAAPIRFPRRRDA